MKALVGTFNQEKAKVGASSVIVKLPTSRRLISSSITVCLCPGFQRSGATQHRLVLCVPIDAQNAETSNTMPPLTLTQPYLHSAQVLTCLCYVSPLPLSIETTTRLLPLLPPVSGMRAKGPKTSVKLRTIMTQLSPTNQECNVHHCQHCHHVT